MGLLSSIGSAVGGALSAVGNALSSVGSAICSGISSLCTSVGGKIFAGIATLATSLVMPGVGLPEILFVINAISAIVSTIAEILGVKEENETPEELGMKAEICDRKPEDFDSIEEYIKYLHEEINLDENAVENLSDEERAKYTAVGTAINIKAIEEKYGLEASGEFWKTVADMKLSGEQVKVFMDTFKENGIGQMQDMTDYLKDKETKNEKSLVSDSILESLGKLYPEMSSEQLEGKLADMEIEE